MHMNAVGLWQSLCKRVDVTWPTKFMEFSKTGSWQTTNEIFQNSQLSDNSC